MKAATNEENTDYSLPPFWIGIIFIRIGNAFSSFSIVCPTIQLVSNAPLPLWKSRRCRSRCNGGPYERRPSA